MKKDMFFWMTLIAVITIVASILLPAIGKGPNRDQRGDDNKIEYGRLAIQRIEGHTYVFHDYQGGIVHAQSCPCLRSE